MGQLQAIEPFECCIPASIADDFEERPKQHLSKNDNTLGFNLDFTILTPPILRDEHTLTLLYIDPSDNKPKYTDFDLKHATLSSTTTTIECDSSFNFLDTVYAFNSHDGKLYFIEKNTSMLSLDIRHKHTQMIRLDGRVVTTNNNHAQIVYSEKRKKLYIMGAEQKSDIDANFECVPYSTAQKFVSASEGYLPLIEGFGFGATAMTVSEGGLDWIYVLCGEHVVDNDLTAPNDQMFRYALSDDGDDESSQRWRNSYFVQPAFMHGVINYHDLYLFSFGGLISFSKRVEPAVDTIYVLTLDEEECKRCELEKATWYELRTVRLPHKGNFHAVYTGQGKRKSNVVHLFSYQGEYLQMEMAQILKAVQTGLATGELVRRHEWNICGKTVLPTRSYSIKNMVPKGVDEEVDSDDEDGDNDEPAQQAAPNEAATEQD